LGILRVVPMWDSGVGEVSPLHYDYILNTRGYLQSHSFLYSYT
jgi:hypothetical protein